MNKLILERVPLEERLKAVYLPVAVMDCSCYIADELLGYLKLSGKDCTKKGSRLIKSSVEQYRKDNYSVMRAKLYADLSDKTRKFYESIIRDFQMYKLQYRQELLNRNISANGLETAIVMTYILKELVNYSLELDRDYAAKISSYIGNELHYRVEANQNCLNIIAGADSILTSLELPLSINSGNIELSYKIFKNNILSVKIWK